MGEKKVLATPHASLAPTRSSSLFGVMLRMPWSLVWLALRHSFERNRRNMALGRNANLIEKRHNHWETQDHTKNTRKMQICAPTDFFRGLFSPGAILRFADALKNVPACTPIFSFASDF